MADKSEIHVLDKKVVLRQPEGGFRTSMDSVFLAASCPAKANETVLDMGCGVGGASFCLLYREPEIKLTGVEVEKVYFELAQENAELNDMAVTFINEDVLRFSPEACFDHVLCNPPYWEAGAHIPSPEDKLASARGHQKDDVSIKEWIDAAYRNLKQGGSFTIIHSAAALDKIIQALGSRFGGIEIYPLWPKEGVDAKRIIVRARKDRKTPLTLHSGLILHDNNGAHTGGSERILKHGERLF